MDADNKRFKIADFGVATQVIGENTNTKRTETGTAWYMSPEVIKSEAYSYPIDIWAVGCILYELISGKRPYYTCKNKFAAMFAVANNETPLHKSDSKIKKKFKDEVLKDFLNKCWDSDPSKRGNASELLEHEFLSSTHVD
jgi:serine/threonine protein kinase